ncbi:MAG: HD-GYP domain-containing protein [Planctomycetota bacterium]
MLPTKTSTLPDLPSADAGHPSVTWAAGDRVVSAGLGEALQGLEEAFGQSFAVMDLASGRLESVSADWLGGDIFSRAALCEEVARRGRVEVLEDCAPLLVLAIPLTADAESTDLLAVSTFLTQPVSAAGEIAPAAAALGVAEDHALRWAEGRTAWPPAALLSVGRSWHNAEAHRQKNEQLKAQLTDVSSHLLSTFEELSMLHRLTERLSLSSSESELCELALHWLSDIVPAENLVVMINTPQTTRTTESGPTTEVLSSGNRRLEESEFPSFIERLGPEAARRALVLNRDKTSSPTWCYPDIKELISVPIRAGERVLGWLFALNYVPGAGVDTEFGTIEASLLSSVAAILGVHCGNIDLYREQSEFFESVIRALSSSIDAKDPYTCGHSDRVARIAVCLARQIGCNAEELNTIYLSGLLHDIGKIGIDDNVLRKPGKLTKEEYEHIKAHPELGYKILEGVKQLHKVLPVVLHHHEAWDGSGYPTGLAAEECPRLARIVAVADSIDAMGSDRPYRKGMPAEKLDSILQAGAGRQWDPDVISGYFTVRDEVRRITATERAPQALDVREWDATQEPSDSQPAPNKAPAVEPVGATQADNTDANAQP